MRSQPHGQHMSDYSAWSINSLTPSCCSMNMPGQRINEQHLSRQKSLSTQRTKSRNNSKMMYLNVQLAGLTGTQHVALSNINTTQDALRLRYHLKFLTGDYLTAERQSLDQGTSPRCKLCPAEVESVEHVLTKCSATEDIHSRMLPEILNVVHQVQPLSSILVHQTQHLTQFILDCTSINLPESYRIPACDWCYTVCSRQA